MLSVAEVTKSYGRQIVFEDISFTVGDGERMGLVGRNGSGKTTLFRLLVGEEQPDSGSINIPRGYSIGYLTQNLSFTEGTVLREASLGLPVHEDGVDETYKVKHILLGLGFAQADFTRAPHELSSGYQIRLNLAKILVAHPDLLLLDEPTNYLDIVSVRWLGHFLRNWKRELILITHDRAFMDSVVTHIMGIHRQGIRKVAGTTHKLYQQILQEEEVYEKTRVNDDRKRKELEQFINRFRAQATRAKAVQSRIRALAKRKALQRLSEARNLDFEFTSAAFSGKWLMEVHDLGFAFESPLISGLSFPVGKNDRVAVIGKNGRGKTTLLNLLAGDLSPQRGAINRSTNLEIGYFGQSNIDLLHPENTVEDEIMQAHPGFSRGQARNICGLMLFDGEKALKKVSVLSGGEKSRVLLGKILVKPANLLLLDEPTNHLDMESVDSLIEAIAAFDGAVILATHSEMIIHAVADKLVVFDGGLPWFFDGSYQDFLDRVGWQDEEPESTQDGRTEDKRSQRSDKKELKRIRAEIISERSRILSPLDRDMTRLEKAIVALERRIEDENRALLRASQVGEGKAIASLSISIHDCKRQIEGLFEELDAVSREHVVRMREFENRLEELRAAEGAEGSLRLGNHKISSRESA